MVGSGGRRGVSSKKDLEWLEEAHSCLANAEDKKASYEVTLAALLDCLCDLFSAERAFFLGPFDSSAESCALYRVEPRTESSARELVIVTPSLVSAMRRACGTDAVWARRAFDPALRFGSVAQELHIWVGAGESAKAKPLGGLIGLHWSGERERDAVDARLFAGLARSVADKIESAKYREDMRTSEAILDTIWQSSPLGLAVVQADGRCTRVNTLVSEWLGRSRQELLHTLAADWLPPALSGGQTHWIGDLPVGSAGAHSVAMSQTPVVGAGDSLTLLQVSEQSSLRRLEGELYELQRHKLFGTLSSGVVHDLNNLMTVIFSALETAEHKPESASLPELFVDAKEAALRCETLCGQLMTMGRTRPGAMQRVQPDAELMAMKRLLSRVLRDDTTFKVRLEAPTAVVDLPTGALQQIMITLLVNAREAIGSNGSVEISTWMDDAHFCIAVEDDGKGMTEPVLARVFEPFFTTKEQVGSGIGLAVVQRLMAQVDGRIDAQSTVGKGSRFELSFSLASMGLPHAPSEPEQEWRGDELIAVVCENEPVLREVISRALGERGFEVLSAPDGRRARDLLEGGHGFDLLVTDLIMPNSGGIATALACNEGDHRTPVVFLSGLMDPSSIPDLPVATRFLAKPFRMGELLAAVQAVLTDDEG